MQPVDPPLPSMYVHRKLPPETAPRTAHPTPHPEAEYETLWDDGTDTHALLGWSDSDVVLSFRGRVAGGLWGLR